MLKYAERNNYYSMSSCSHPQFRVSDSRESIIQLMLPVSGDRTLSAAFADFDLFSIWKDTELSTSNLKLVLYADSVKAKTKKITNGLIGSSCLNVKQHRIITFQSTMWERLNANECLLYGKLALWGVCKMVVFEVAQLEPLIHSNGILKQCKLMINGSIKPSDFKLSTDNYPSDLNNEIQITGSLVFKSKTKSELSHLQNSVDRFFKLVHSLNNKR